MIPSSLKCDNIKIIAPWPIARACHDDLNCSLTDHTLEKPANKLLLQRKARVPVLCNQAKENLEEEGRGRVIGDRDRCRGIEGLC